MIGKCPGCGWSPKTGKTRDLNKHMDLTRFRPCRALLQLTQAQNISQTGNTIQAPAPVDNLALASEDDLISFDKNPPTHQPAQPSVPAVDLLTNDIPEADPEAGPGPRTQIHREQKKKLVLTINELIKWLSKPEIKNNKKIKSKLVPKTDKEWFDLMESNISEPSNPEPQAYHFLDLDIEVSWPVLFPDDEKHCAIWQKGIQYAKDIFKVDGAEYAFSTWFIDTEELKLEAGMTEGDESQAKIAFKIIDKYEPIRESKKTGRKYVRGGPNVILTKKTKPGFWVGIDEKFLVREVSEQSEVGKLDSNAVVYGLYRIRKPDVNRLIPIKDGALNCVAQRVIEHFDNTK
ncbi:15973_t:CDS:2 [Cetraspora pellucida]|uniref:15973_t:CDS:1 n=1 Tax=Cetraspora pellucida TaxID=1433469 RepID=A0ACA9KWZ3_9GLOM|nr:15973_t:CDS:2 [Cetraspora pellucida]